MAPLRPSILVLATSIALASCTGGGSTGATPTPAPSCMPGAATYALFPDPMTQPPAGSTGVATTIGTITVPQMNNVLGATVQIIPPAGSWLNGGVFVANGASSLSATIPQLQPNTVYHAFAVGVPCGPDFDFGQFTTGAT